MLTESILNLIDGPLAGNTSIINKIMASDHAYSYFIKSMWKRFFQAEYYQESLLTNAWKFLHNYLFRFHR